MSGVVRGQRLAGTIRKLLSASLARSVEDPRLLAVGIENVSMSRDLGVATVAVRLMYGESDDAAQKAVLSSLQKFGPHLRAGLAAALRMRRVPELRFIYDVGEDHRRNVERLLAEIDAEPKGAPVEHPEDSPEAPPSPAPSGSSK